MASMEMNKLIPLPMTDSVSATASPGVLDRSDDSDVESRLCDAPPALVGGNDTGHHENETLVEGPDEDGGNPINPATLGSRSDLAKSDGVLLTRMNTKKKRVRRLKEDYKKLDESWDKVLLKLIPDEPITALSEKEVAEISSCVDYLLSSRKASPNSMYDDGNTVLHRAAEGGYMEVTEMLLHHEAKPNEKNLDGEIPLVVALNEIEDEIAARLMRAMKPEDVRRIFICEKSEKGCQYKDSFHKLIKYSWLYKLSLAAALDCMVGKSSASGFPEYQFWLAILGTDKQGRSVDDPRFSKETVLHTMSEDTHKDELNHVAVKWHITRKYERYFGTGKWKVTLSFFLYILVMTFALVAGGVAEDPTKYNKGIDYFRAICEILTLMFCCYQLGFEAQQLKKLTTYYFMDVYNYVDVTGFGLFIFVVLPLRYTESPAQWSVAAVGYMITGLRFFKYLRANKSLAEYTQILAKLLQEDMIKFMVVFFIFLVTFCGSFLLALRGHVTSVSGSNGTNLTMSDLDTTNNAMSYPVILFTGLRILVEGEPIVSYYEADQRLGWLPILILLLFLFSIVVLLNIMVAQLSDSYQNMQQRILSNRLFLIVEYERQFPEKIQCIEEGEAVVCSTILDESDLISKEDFQSVEDRANVKPDAQVLVLNSLSKLLTKQKKMEKKLRRIVNHISPQGGEQNASVDEPDTSDSSDNGTSQPCLRRRTRRRGVKDCPSRGGSVKEQGRHSPVSDIVAVA